LYCSTNRLCRCGAPVKNLAHSASLQLLDKIAPSKFGIKQLVEGKPLETSFGEDLYKKIFGVDAEVVPASPRLREIA
jgi:hypothetical protein